MSLTLYLDRYRWLAHFRKLEQVYPGYIPVIKGNGYGFGNNYLAHAAWEYGKTSIAVGTIEEARQLVEAHDFDEIIVLSPVFTNITAFDLSKFTFTVGSVDQLKHLIDSSEGVNNNLPIKVLLKCETSMKRYGFTPKILATAKDILTNVQTNVQIQGFAMHFPLERIAEQDKLEQIKTWVKLINSQGLNCERMYVSHLGQALLQKLQLTFPNTSFIMRLGTELWLGEKKAYSFRTTVLDVKPLDAGQRFGYKQKRNWRAGHLIYVSGGSANGVGLEAPVHTKGLKGRLKLTVFWLLSLCNLSLSPFMFRGQRLWFAEPPHMQASVLKIAKKIPPPKPGEEIELKNLRMTIATFDTIVEIQPQEHGTLVIPTNIAQ